MHITVEYFAQLRGATGAATATVEVEASCTAQDLVARLAAEHGLEFQRMVLAEGGGLRPSVLLFVDGRQVPWGEPRELADGETLLLATPVAGG